jgi:threonine aldolase
LASGAMYAVDNHLQLLKHDHLNAKRIANVLKGKFKVDLVESLDTNMIYFDAQNIDMKRFAEYLRLNGFTIFGSQPIERWVFHHQITDKAVDQLETLIKDFL